MRGRATQFVVGLALLGAAAGALLLFLLLLCGSAQGLTTPPGAPYNLLTGTFAAANGVPLQNGVIGLVPTQVMFVGGTGVVVGSSSCATSINGAVVGIRNPLTPPVVSVVSGTGTLPPGNYYVGIDWVDAQGGVTLLSPLVTAQLTMTGSLVVSPPVGGPASGVPVAMQIFIGTAPSGTGAPLFQGASLSPTASYTQASALATGGSPVPTSNTTACYVVSNDAAWPIAGYAVTLTDAYGNTLPGYPQVWQFLNPGSTYNLSTGIPIFNGHVIWPNPIVAQPYNNNMQSIAGPLSMGTTGSLGYNVVNVGFLGVGTSVPAWGVDLEATPGTLESEINANGGYLVNGQGGTTGWCLASDGTAYDTPLPCLTSASLFYQTVVVNGTTEPQRAQLGFDAYFTGTDSASPSRTTVHPVTTGTEPQLVTATEAGTTNHCVKWLGTGGIGDSGSVCAGAGWSTNRICNANGCYRIASDGSPGTVEEWFTTGTLNNNSLTTITLPYAYPTGDFLYCSCSNIGDRVSGGNVQPVGCGAFASGPQSQIYLNTPASDVQASCYVTSD